MVSDAILDQSRTGKVGASAAEPRVSASRTSRLSVCLHPSSPVLEHRIAKKRPPPQKKKINTSPGNKVEEDGKIPTSNQRDERKLPH